MASFTVTERKSLELDDLTKYAFASGYEPLALKLLCSEAGDALIEHVDSEAFDDPVSQWIVQAIKICHKEHGRCPRDITTLAQQFKVLLGKSKLTQQEYDNILVSAAGYFSCTYPDRDLVHKQLLEQVQSVGRYKALDAGHSEMAETANTEVMQAKLASLEALEATESKPSIVVQGNCDGLFASLNVETTGGTFPTGITELDVQMEGGGEPGDAIAILAPTGAGKSRAQNGMENVWLGCNKHVFHFSNELSPRKSNAMHVGCALGVASNAVLKNPAKRKEYQRRYTQLVEQDPRGTYVFKWFNAGEITIEGVWDHIMREQDALKLEFDVISADFLAKLAYKKYQSKYDGITAATEFICAKAIEHKKLFNTTHQGKQRADIAENPLGMNDAADCAGVPRTVDFVWTLNPNYSSNGTIIKDAKSIKVNVAKTRDYEPIPPFMVTHDYRCAALHKNQIGWRPIASRDSYNSNLYNTEEIL